MTKKSFFMVYLEDGGTPTVQYEDLLKAEKEAMRLSEKYMKKAFVLATLKSYTTLRYEIQDCRPEDSNLPF